MAGRFGGVSRRRDRGRKIVAVGGYGAARPVAHKRVLETERSTSKAPTFHVPQNPGHDFGIQVFSPRVGP
jgi:hypothetical protein